jgi:hypothetical protein
MKRGLFATMIVGIALTAASRDAAAQRRIVPFAGGGLAKGMGDLSDNTGNGWVVFGGVDLPIAANPALTLGVTASYAHVPYEGSFGEATNIPGVFAELGYSFLAASASKLKPYVRAGGGAMIHKYDPGSTAFRETSEGKLAFSGGAGLQMLVSSFAIFAGGHVVTDGNAGYLAIHGGLAFPGTPSR